MFVDSAGLTALKGSWNRRGNLCRPGGLGRIVIRCGPSGVLVSPATPAFES